MMTEQQLPLNIEGLEQYQSKLENTSGAWLKAFRQKSFDQWAHRHANPQGRGMEIYVLGRCGQSPFSDRPPSSIDRG